MNPNPEQPDAPFTIDAGDGLLFIRETKSFLYVATFNADQRNRGRALITLAALNASKALAPAGWDAARVFERLPEVMRVLDHNCTGFAAQLKLKRDTAGGGR